MLITISRWRRIASPLLILLTLGGCAQFMQTGRTVSDNNGVLLDGDAQYLGQRRYKLMVRGSSIAFDGQAEQFFRQRAEGFAKSKGCRGWKLHEYRAGTENTLLGARRYAEGVIECLG